VCWLPLRTVTIGSKDPYFIRPLVKSLLRKRNKLAHKRKHYTVEAITKKIGELISENRQKLIYKANDGNVKALWRAVKSTANDRVRNNCILSNDTGINNADKLNQYFAEIATDVDYNITSPIHFRRCDPDTDLVITEETVFARLGQIKKTAAGPDNIPYWFLQKFNDIHSQPVCIIFNKILSCATIPKLWRHAASTPVPKVKPPKQFSDLRPISVTCILSRVFERIVLRKFIIPFLPAELLLDQYAFKPSGSTTAALVNLYENVTSMLETNSYVHCISVDFSKAFDTVNHGKLLEKLGALPIHPGIVALVSSFLFDRTQSTCLNGVVSAPATITLSVVQGSGLGPVLYIIFKSDLKPISRINKICKYADDLDLLVPQNTDIAIETEFDNILKWSDRNKLILNKGKTKQIIFRRPNVRHILLPSPLAGLEVVESLKFLGVFVNCQFNQAEHVRFIVSISNQRLYLLNILKHNGLFIHALDCLFKSLIVSRVVYAIEAWGNFVSREQQSVIDKMFKKAKKWKLCKDLNTFDEIKNERMSRLFSKIRYSSHCLHHLLPPLRDEFYQLRERTHPYKTPRANKTLYKNSFLIHMLSQYHVIC